MLFGFVMPFVCFQIFFLVEFTLSTLLCGFAFYQLIIDFVQAFSSCVTFYFFLIKMKGDSSSSFYLWIPTVYLFSSFSIETDNSTDCNTIQTFTHNQFFESINEIANLSNNCFDEKNVAGGKCNGAATAKCAISLNCANLAQNNLPVKIHMNRKKMLQNAMDCHVQR